MKLMGINGSDDILTARKSLWINLQLGVSPTPGTSDDLQHTPTEHQEEGYV